MEEIETFEGGFRGVGGIGGTPTTPKVSNVPVTPDPQKFDTLMGTLRALAKDAGVAVQAVQDAITAADVAKAEAAGRRIEEQLDGLKEQIGLLGVGAAEGAWAERPRRREEWAMARKAADEANALGKRMRKERAAWFKARKAAGNVEREVESVRLQADGPCDVDYDDVPIDLVELDTLQGWNDDANADSPQERVNRDTWPAPPRENMKVNSLARIDWDLWRKHLIAHCLSPAYTPIRTNCAYREDAPTPYDGVDRPGSLPPVTMNGLKTFRELSVRVVLDLVPGPNRAATGALYFRSVGADGSITDRRILADMGEKRAIFARYWHDPTVCGHRGRDSTFERLSSTFFNLSRQEVHMFIQQTETYQVSSKTHNMEKVTNPLVTSAPMEHWQMDLVDFLSRAKDNSGYTFMLVVVDCFSKFIWAFPLKKKRAEEVLDNLKRLFYTEGFPTILQSDNGGEFVAKESTEFYRKAGILFRTGRAYKPSTQGQVERSNRTIKQAIYHDMLTSGNSSWVSELPQRIFTYNTLTQSSTGRTPYELHRGRKSPWMPGPEALMASVRTVVDDRTAESLQLTFPGEDQVALRSLVASDERLLVAAQRDAYGGGIDRENLPLLVRQILETQRTYLAPGLLVGGYTPAAIMDAEPTQRTQTRRGPSEEEETPEGVCPEGEVWSATRGKCTRFRRPTITEANVYAEKNQETAFRSIRFHKDDSKNASAYKMIMTTDFDSWDEASDMLGIGLTSAAMQAVMMEVAASKSDKSDKSNKSKRKGDGSGPVTEPKKKKKRKVTFSNAPIEN